MSRLALKVIKGSMKGEEFLFEETGLCLIGRDESCSISIPREKDVGISRRHCLLIITDSNIRIRDLYSTNGTYVNSHRLIPSPIGDDPEKEDVNDRFLAPGDKISVSNIQMEVQIKSKIESGLETTSLPLEDPIPTTNTTKTRLIQFAHGRTRSDSLIPEPNNVDNKIVPIETPIEDTHLFLSLPITEPIPKPKLWEKKDKAPQIDDDNSPAKKRDSIEKKEKEDKKQNSLQSKEENKMPEKPDLSIITGNTSLPDSDKTSEPIHEEKEEIATFPEINESTEEEVKESPQQSSLPEYEIAKEQTQEKKEETSEPELEIEAEIEISEESPITDETEIASSDTEPPKIEKKQKLFDVEKMQALEELAGTLAYDFNEQFKAIEKQSELLKEETNPEKIKEYAEEIFRIAEHSTEMTEQLLMFAYHDKDQETETVNLVELLTEIASVMKHTAGRKIEIKYIQPRQPHTLFTKGSQLDIYEAILNIAFNALESITKRGVITLKINQVVLIDEDIAHFAFPIDPGSFIKITIEDTGSGIEDDNLTRIFDPFFTTKSDEEALGMGLTVAYGITKSHNGAIEIKSTSQKGTCFEIYLPLAENKKGDK